MFHRRPFTTSQPRSTGGRSFTAYKSPLTDEGDPDLHPAATSLHDLGTFHFNNRMEVVGSDISHADFHTINYVEKVLRRTGVLKALDRPQWLP